VNNLAPDATPDPLPAWEATGWQIAIEDSRYWDDKYDHDYDTDPDD
jgi:hypothetical protein